MTAPRVRVFGTPEEVGAGAADDLVAFARRCVAERGAFHVALSGGSTPAHLYRALRGRPPEDSLDWSRVFVTFSDERTVPPESPDSNFGLAWRELLSHVPIPEEQISRMRGELAPQDAAREYEARLPERLDLVLLGMGDDGHTASLFPGTDALAAPGRVAATWVEKLGTWRLTLTFPEIGAARERWLLVTGAGKVGALTRVLAGGSGLPVEGVPDPVWYVDEAAAVAFGTDPR